MPITSSGSGGGGGAVLLYDSGYLGAPAASIDTGAASIPAGHVSLIIYTYLRSTAAVTSDNILLTFNNDSSALYDFSRTQNSNSAVSGASSALQTSYNFGNCPGASAAANIFGPGFATVLAYDGATTFKVINSQCGAAQDTAAGTLSTVTSGAYQSATAITRVKIAPGSGPNFLTGSRMVIYGAQ